MATERYWRCEGCGHEQWAGQLFPSLLAVAEKKIQACGKCGKPRHLRLIFDHGLGVGKHPCKTLAAYYPRRKVEWTNGSANVRFYPFLVILRSEKEHYQAAWLPYWHVVEDAGTKKHKYGQWAPFIGEREFKDLLRQAKEDGYMVTA